MPSQDVRTNVKRSYYASERNNVLGCTRTWAILTLRTLWSRDSFPAVVTWFCCPAKKDGCPPVLWESQLKHSERSCTKRAPRVFGQMRGKQGIEHANLWIMAETATVIRVMGLHMACWVSTLTESCQWSTHFENYAVFWQCFECRYIKTNILTVYVQVNVFVSCIFLWLVQYPSRIVTLALNWN